MCPTIELHMHMMNLTMCAKKLWYFISIITILRTNDSLKIAKNIFHLQNLIIFPNILIISILKFILIASKRSWITSELTELCAKNIENYEYKQYLQILPKL